MKITDLISQVRATQARVLAERKTARESIDAVRALCATEDRDPTDGEATQVTEAADVVRAKDAELATLAERLTHLVAEQRQDDATDALARQTTPVLPSPDHERQTTTMTITRTERQYRADDVQNGKPGFLRDLYAGQVNHDPGALERLARHGHEIEVDNPGLAERAVNTGAVSGFVPPQYLTDQFAELARAGRPVANLCSKYPLPDRGMVLNIPRITTGTLTGVQTTENATVANQDLDDTLLSVPVVTVAGYTDTSRQAIERGEGTETLILTDLAADYNAKLDAQIINGSGSGGQHLGILGVSGTNAITYTDASPTPQELWPKIADAVRKVVSQRFTGATAIAMTPLTWGWILSTVDSVGRPLIDVLSAGQNVLGKAGTPQYEGVAGYLFGVPVILDGNIPASLGGGTNETAIIAADFRDLYLAEDASAAPAQLKFEGPLSSSLGVRLVAYGYSAFAAGRQPTAISKVTGTGLVIPGTL
jgi:HK97 family phage major capsid protein